MSKYIILLLATIITFIPVTKDMGEHESSVNQVVGAHSLSEPISQLKTQPLKALEQKGTAKTANTPQAKPTAPKQAPAGSGSNIKDCVQLRSRLASLGVPSNQLDSAITLAKRESTCRSSAVNSSSGACGTFQSYPCGKWGSPGTDQYLRGAIKYSNDRYGGFNGALAHSYSEGWY